MGFHYILNPPRIYIVLHSKLFRRLEFTNSLYPDQLNEQVVSVYKMANKVKQ